MPRSVDRGSEPSYLEPVVQELRHPQNPENLKHLSFNSTDTQPDTVPVFVRVKPLASAEGSNWLTWQGQEIVLKKKSTEHSFRFSCVLGPEVDQRTVYESVVRPRLALVRETQHSVFCAYGASNAGKTYTLHGVSGGEGAGLIPRTVVELLTRLKGKLDLAAFLCPFRVDQVTQLGEREARDNLAFKSRILQETRSMEPYLTKKKGFIPFSEWKALSEGVKEEEPDGSIVSCWLSYLEIYNDRVFDLLAGCQDRTELRIRGGGGGGFYFAQGMQYIQVCNIQEAYLVYSYGRQNLRTGYTGANDNSSRSHSVLTLTLIGRRPNDTEEFTFRSDMAFCDLAGCERAVKTRNEGVRLTESRAINSSFLVLNRCIQTIKENQTKELREQKLPPYRDSKLTQLLAPALAGRHSHLSLLVAVSAGLADSEETEQTLKCSNVAASVRQTCPKKRNRFSLAVAALAPGQQVAWAEVAAGRHGASAAIGEEASAALQELRAQLEEERRQRLEERRQRLETEERLQQRLLAEQEARAEESRGLQDDSQKRILELEEDKRNLAEDLMKVQRRRNIALAELEERERECKSLKELLDDAKDEIEELQESKDNEIATLMDQNQELLLELNEARLRIELLEEERELNQKTIAELRAAMPQIPVLEIETGSDDSPVILTAPQNPGRKRAEYVLRGVTKMEPTLPKVQVEGASDDEARLESPKEVQGRRRSRSAPRTPKTGRPRRSQVARRASPRRTQKHEEGVADPGAVAGPSGVSENGPTSVARKQKRRLFLGTSDLLESSAPSESSVRAADETQASPGTIFRTLRSGKPF